MEIKLKRRLFDQLLYKKVKDRHGRLYTKATNCMKT